mmetsp:Transcript_28781/g.32916  ORF Transcript_28781/g.32916 Transcript_28781/m.32916 type:complete len:100 (+) Transcript_28781:1-300(+)
MREFRLTKEKEIEQLQRTLMKSHSSLRSSSESIEMASRLNAHTQELSRQVRSGSRSTSTSPMKGSLEPVRENNEYYSGRSHSRTALSLNQLRASLNDTS